MCWLLPKVSAFSLVTNNCCMKDWKCPMFAKLWCWSVNLPWFLILCCNYLIQAQQEVPDFLENAADSAVGTYHGGAGGSFGGRDTRRVSSQHLVWTWNIWVKGLLLLVCILLYRSKWTGYIPSGRNVVGPSMTLISCCLVLYINNLYIPLVNPMRLFPVYTFFLKKDYLGPKQS